MEIYRGSDEPDGLYGLAHLRKSLAGNWEEILTSCEQSLHLEPTSIQRHSDVLICLLYMCQLQAMVSCSESNACFDMDVAKILQAMSKKYQFSVVEILVSWVLGLLIVQKLITCLPSPTASPPIILIL
ncbi:hypothetical protein MKW92_046634, partial [Papaver armeniacum]